MTDPRTKFEQALAAFATPGNRWGGASPLTYWAAACGLTVDEVIEAAHGVGVCSRDADIRRGMVTAAAKVQANAAVHSSGDGSVRRYVRAKPTAPKQPTDRVRRLIEAGRDISTPERLRELSPVRICADADPLARRVQAELQLLALFGPTDKVRFRKGKTDNTRSRPGDNLKPLAKWLTGGGVHPVDYGELVRVNPLTGEKRQTKAGVDSYDAQACVADLRHMVWEFDALPLPDQCRFWAGVIRRGALPLVCLVHSGGKSIHGVVEVNAPDADTWARCRAATVERYASDPDERYRLDSQAISPLTGCRLAGVRRADTGAVQELLFVRRGWRDRTWERELNPPESAKPTPPPADTPAPPPFPNRCDGCAAVRDCRAAFGRFWADRSSGGVGCNHPFGGWKRLQTNSSAQPQSTTQKCFTL